MIHLVSTSHSVATIPSDAGRSHPGPTCLGRQALARRLALVTVLVLTAGAWSSSAPATPAPAPADMAATATPADCTPDQCKKMGTNACGTAAPYACLSDGGCYTSSNVSSCKGTACNFGTCPNAPGFVAPDQRPSRTVTFVNQCDAAIDIYFTGAGQGNKPTKLLTVAKGASTPHTVTLNKGTNSISGKTFYELPGGAGINFGAYPSDGDVASMTLFEINMGGNQGQADWYDLSAIPPGSCASHMNAAITNYAAGLGYADHLPFKDISDPSQNWDCLQDAAGDPIAGTCGDGLGGFLCPKVKGSVEAMKAVKGTNRGWGVPGEKCCAEPGTGQQSGVDCPKAKEGATCIPQVCAMADGDDPLSNTVRQKVYDCALAQAKAVAATKTDPPRATGFSYPMKVEATWTGTPPDFASTCTTKSCTTDSSGLPTAATCDAYLWPYDDEAATVICDATPDYKVTLCP